eukprot:6909844-Alexandrium_andersonii.AAC.1
MRGSKPNNREIVSRHCGGRRSPWTLAEEVHRKGSPPRLSRLCIRRGRQNGRRPSDAPPLPD